MFQRAFQQSFAISSSLWCLNCSLFINAIYQLFPCKNEYESTLNHCKMHSVCTLYEPGASSLSLYLARLFSLWVSGCVYVYIARTGSRQTRMHSNTSTPHPHATITFPKWEWTCFQAAQKWTDATLKYILFIYIDGNGSLMVATTTATTTNNTTHSQNTLKNIESLSLYHSHLSLWLLLTSIFISLSQQLFHSPLLYSIQSLCNIFNAYE